jgi:hypothetical protein
MNVSKHPLSFNFHGIVAAQVYTTSSQVLTFYEAEYKYHQVKKLNPEIPKVILRFEYKPGWIPCPTGYVRQSHKALAHWVFRIEFTNDQIHIDAYGNYFAIPMVHHMLLHPALRYFACQKGVLMLHAGAVAHLGSSLIFTGHGGAGKTTTTSLTLASGGSDWDVHADDYVFLSAGPNSLAYITRSHLYRDLIALLPEIGARLTRSERLRLKMYGRIRSWSNDRITWPVRLPVNRLWPDHPIADTAIPAAFILLEESDSEQLELEYVAPQDVPVGDLIEMNFSEAQHFLNLIRKNQALSNFASWLVEWQQNEQALLEERTKEIPVYLLKRPGDVRTLSSFQDALMEIMVDLVQQKDTNYLP